MTATFQANVGDNPGSELIVIGSDDRATAKDAVARVGAFLSAAPQAPLRDVAYTCALEAQDAPFWIAVVASSCGDLRDKLGFALHRLKSGIDRNSFNKGIYIGTEQCPAPGRTVFLFPGEGTQYPDMLRDLALHFQACRAAFDAADTAVASAAASSAEISRNVPFPPSHYVFPPTTPAQGAEIKTLETPIAIQTVIAADTALLFLLSQLGLAPDAVMGVGVGEMVAMECAGAISLPTKRNRIMLLGKGFQMISGIAASGKPVADCATLSVSGLTRETLASSLAPFGDDALVAADQTPELFTIAVAPAAEKNVREKLEGLGASIHRLPSITKPFHTPLMAPFEKAFLDYYGKFVNASPSIPIYSCCTQGPIPSDEPGDIARVAAMQWTNPINVSGTIRRLYDDGFRVFVELGARGGLTACVSSTLRHLPHLAVATNRGHRPDMLQLHHALAALASHGAKFNIAALHATRGSQKLDFDRPGDFRPRKRQPETPIPHSLPVLSDVAVPRNLVSLPRAVGAASESAGDADSPDFPCIDYAEVVRFSPSDLIELTLRLSTADFPYMAARAFAAGPVSSYNKAASGLILAPLELLAEIMTETARKIAPDSVAAAIEDLETADAACAVPAEGRSVRVQARRMANRGGATIVAVAVYEAESFNADAPEVLASCKVTLSGRHADSPPETALSLMNAIRVGWAGDDIYPKILPNGECCRTIRGIAELGENGLVAECILPPKSSMVRSTPRPSFSAAMSHLSAAADALAVLHSREPASGLIELFSGASKIEFYGPPQQTWSTFTVKVSSALPKPGDPAASANVEFIDGNHRVFMRISGLTSRLVKISPQLHRLILDPIGGMLSDEIPPALLPALPHEVVCCKIDDDWPDDRYEELRLKIAACIALTPAELEKWKTFGGARHRRHEWLFGRIAAKDAVRKCLLARYGRQIGAADIAIESDESGKPSPQGQWRKTCGAQMDISITHTQSCVLAAAAPNASLGIDAEYRGRQISEDFATFAFSALEQELAAESGDGAATLFRFWCAKEALSKALGTGLRFGPNDISARSLDAASGKIEMEASRLWLERFPQLRGVEIPVHSCTVGELVLAVCALNQSLVAMS